MITIKEIRAEVLEQQQDRKAQFTQELTEKLPKMIANAFRLNDVTPNFIGLTIPHEYVARLMDIPMNEITEMFKTAFREAVGAEISSIEWPDHANKIIVNPATSFEI